MTSKKKQPIGPVVINKRYEPECPIDSIKLHPRNARRGDLAMLDESIEENGFYGAVVVQESTRYILVGNHRWMSAKHHGMPTIPTFFVEVNDKDALKILLADNRLSDVAGYDEQGLANLLSELKNEDALRGTGYNAADVDALLEALADQALGDDDGDEESPDDFDNYDEDLETEHTCPKCGYQFSGGDKAKGKGKRKKRSAAEDDADDAPEDDAESEPF